MCELRLFTNISKQVTRRISSHHIMALEYPEYVAALFVQIHF